MFLKIKLVVKMSQDFIGKKFLKNDDFVKYVFENNVCYVIV